MSRTINLWQQSQSYGDWLNAVSSCFKLSTTSFHELSIFYDLIFLFHAALQTTKIIENRQKKNK